MPYCILMKTWPGPRFPFSADGWGVLLQKKAHILSAFSPSSCFIGCFISTTYHCFTMKAAFQLIPRFMLFHRGRAQEECLFQERKSEFVSDANQTGGKEGETGYSQKDSKTPKNLTDSVSNWGHLARNSVIWSLITELTGSRACVELGTFLCFESRETHGGFHQAGWGSLHRKTFDPVLFFIWLVFHLPQI